MYFASAIDVRVPLQNSCRWEAIKSCEQLTNRKVVIKDIRVGLFDPRLSTNSDNRDKGSLFTWTKKIIPLT